MKGNSNSSIVSPKSVKDLRTDVDKNTSDIVVLDSEVDSNASEISKLKDNTTKIANANGGAAVGSNASAKDGFAGGKDAVSSGDGAVQLGAGTNNTDNSLQFKNYQLVNASGKIPVDRLTVDSSVISESTNPISGGAVYTAIKNVTEIAEGKTATYTISYSTAGNESFNSSAETITLQKSATITDINGTAINLSDVKLGDIFWITNTDVPDRWVGNITSTEIQFFAQETKFSIDSVPTQNSTNAVMSGGVYTALAGKQDTLTFDSTPTSGSTNPVTSGGIYSAVNSVSENLSSEIEARQNADITLQNNIDQKVDKNTVDLSTARVYGQDVNFNERMYQISPNAYGQFLVQRDSNGMFNVNEPTQNTHPASKNYVDTANANKVDKVSSQKVAYVTDSNGDQSTLQYSYTVDNNNLVQRTSEGQVNVPVTPTANSNATSKKYVDDGLSVKADATDVPTKTSDLINDGDGITYETYSGYSEFETTSDYVGYYILVDESYVNVTIDNKDSLDIVPGITEAYILSPYATEYYVSRFGGKIDSITVDNVIQVIDENKNVNLTIPTYRGTYQAGTQYYKGDIIQGSFGFYIALQDCKNQAPSEQMSFQNSYWKQLGWSAANIFINGESSSSKNYLLGSGTRTNGVGSINASSQNVYMQGNKLYSEDTEVAIISDLPKNTSQLINDGDGQEYQQVEGYTTFSSTDDYVGYFVDVNSNYTKVTNENKDTLGILPATTIPYEYSPFATEAYVNTYGGKIDSISVNGTPQTIDANKNVNLVIDNENQTVKTGNVTFGENDAVEFIAGSNVTITGDASAKTITIASTDTDTGATATATARDIYLYNDYTSFTTTSDYIDFLVGVSDNGDIHYTLVTDENKDTLSIVPGTTEAYKYGNAGTSLSYNANNRTMTLNKDKVFVELNDIDNSLSTSSRNPIQNRVIAQLIPAQANSSNQLADKEFVNSSISTNTANFIGTFANITALEAYAGTVTNNDYAFVQNQVLPTDYATFADLDAVNKTTLTNFDYGWVENGSKFDLYRFDIVNQQWELKVQNTNKADVTLNTAYNRYKATVNGSTVAWDYEYTLNNSSFTANQWEAINSGITSGLVTQIGTNQSDISSLQTTVAGKQDALTAGDNIDITNNTISAKDVVTTDTAQTINGQKTFLNQLRVKRPADGGGYFYVSPDGNGYNVKMGFSSGGQMMIHNGGFQIDRTLSPMTANSNLDLGTSSTLWHDLHLKGALKDDNGNTITIADIANKTALAPAYDSTATYAVGDVVVYGNKLYICSTAVETAEAFDSTKWTEITVDSNYVDKTTAETITGEKTITDTDISFKNSNASGNASWQLEEDVYGQLTVSRTYNNIKSKMMEFNGNSIKPVGSNGNLGSASQKWLNIYLSGNLTDGTNSVAVGDIASKDHVLDNYISYTEAQTLTDEQKAQARENIGAGSSNATTVLVNGVAQSSVSFDSDPQTQIDAKLDANTEITGATKTKITYDSKGLVTSGADLEASDIPSLTLSKISDVTASASELNILDGVTASTSEINILDGITATTTELNYVDGVTSSIQTQLDNKQATIDSLHKISSDLVDDTSATNKFVTESEKSQISTNASDITTINSKIPSEASSTNQLADKAFVNSSISTSTATFRGSYNVVNDLGLTSSATTAQVAAALASEISTADNNDYCFVEIPSTSYQEYSGYDSFSSVDDYVGYYVLVGSTYTYVTDSNKSSLSITPGTTEAYTNDLLRVDRYKYVEVSGGTNYWSFEYTLNNSGYTAEQWAAINSGVTDTSVAQISTNATNISSIQSNYVTTDTTQTISGQKKFHNIEANQILGENSQGYFSTNTIRPVADNNYNLGSTTNRWKNAYVSGNLTDGTNEITVADIANKNNVGFPIIPTPSSTTLTDDEKNAIKAGGIVKGNINGLGQFQNYVFYPAGDLYSGYYMGFLVVTRNGYSRLYQYAINDSTNLLSFYGQKYIDIDSSSNFTITGLSKLDFGNNATITRDNDNRINLNYANDAKVKVGSAETLFVNRIGANSDNSQDIGRASVRWKDGYFAGNLSDGTNSVAIAEIAKKVKILNLSATYANQIITFTIPNDFSLEDKQIIVFNLTISSQILDNVQEDYYDEQDPMAYFGAPVYFIQNNAQVNFSTCYNPSSEDLTFGCFNQVQINETAEESSYRIFTVVDVQNNTPYILADIENMESMLGIFWTYVMTPEIQAAIDALDNKYVSFTEAQTLTDEQKAQAKQNIGITDGATYTAGEGIAISQNNEISVSPATETTLGGVRAWKSGKTFYIATTQFVAYDNEVENGELSMQGAYSATLNNGQLALS